MQLSATEKVSVLEKEREAVENNTILSKISMHQRKCKIIIKNHCMFEQLKILFQIFLFHFR